MKKTILILSLITVITLLISACSNIPAFENNSKQVNIPARFTLGLDVEQLFSLAKDDGIKVAKNDDGSLTYKMSEEKHEELMQTMAEILQIQIGDYKGGLHPPIKDVLYDDTYFEFTFIVNRNNVMGITDELETAEIAYMIALYHAYNGVDPEELSITFNYQDESTGEIYKSNTFSEI
ncbi:hypothetical protein [Paenibacillus sp. PL2-23]|uniref:hypothetical protein n=1 Tax=Paenibacillus sp. PL2-23 TaxID=2100729 RepID=UPI0030F72337